MGDLGELARINIMGLKPMLKTVGVVTGVPVPSTKSSLDVEESPCSVYKLTR